MLHANVVLVCFIEHELLSIEVLHYGNMHFRPFGLLWPLPWPDDLHIQIWCVDIPDARKWTSYVKAFESYRLTDILTYRQVTRGHLWSRDKDGGQPLDPHSRKPHGTRKPHGS